MTDEAAEEDPFRLAPTNSSAAQMAAWDPIRFVNTIPKGSGPLTMPMRLVWLLHFALIAHILHERNRALLF